MTFWCQLLACGIFGVIHTILGSRQNEKPAFLNVGQEFIYAVFEVNICLNESERSQKSAVRDAASATKIRYVEVPGALARKNTHLGVRVAVLQPHFPQLWQLREKLGISAGSVAIFGKSKNRLVVS